MKIETLKNGWAKEVLQRIHQLEFPRYLSMDESLACLDCLIIHLGKVLLNEVGALLMLLK
jgi:hypothetical protein